MDVTPKNLPGYLEQIHTFLVNNGKSFIFPSLTMAMENILANIAKDTNYLMKLDNEDCRIWSKRILAVLEENKEMFKLSYCFKDVLGKKVMVYKKKPAPAELKEPLGLKLLRKPHSNTQPASVDNTNTFSTQPASVDNTNTVMSSFKTTCLNATLKFVKNDKQLILQYPDISTEQADFIRHMISECMSSKDVSTTPGGRGMFDLLAEALRIYTPKYDFKLNNGVPDKDDMKRLYLEKKPKKIIITPAVTRDIKDNETCSISSIDSQDRESHQHYTQLIQKLDNNFIRNIILEIKQFLLKQDKEQIVFTNLNVHQGQFIVQFKSILISSDVLKLLDGQDDLRMIKSLWMEKGVCKVKTYMQIVSPTERTVSLNKKWAQDIRHQKDQIQINAENKKITKSTPKIIIETENGIIVNNTTAYSNITTKKTINSLPESKIAMKFSTLNEFMNVTEDIASNVTEDIASSKMTGSMPIAKIKVENDFLNDNKTINTLPKMKINLDRKPFVKVNTDTIKVNNDTNTKSVMKVNNNSSNSSTEKTETEFNITFHSPKVNTTLNFNSEVAEVNNNTTYSVKLNTTKNLSMAKVNTKENSSVAKVNTVENSSVAKVNTAENSSVTKVNTTENSFVAKTITTEKSSVAKVNTIENSFVAKTITTEKSSVATTNATVDSFATKISVSSIELNAGKINEGNDFIVAKASKEIMKNQQLSKKSKQLLSLKTALIIANGRFIEKAITKLRDFTASSEIDMLSFTELSKAEQEIILNWEALINRYEINCMVCVRGQMILDEIRTLLENGRKVFNVKISSKTVSSNRTVTFTKTWKKNPAVGVKSVADLNYPDLLSYCNINKHSTPEKMDKRIQKFCKATNSLTDEWIENSLKQLNNFIQDDAQASLVIPNINDSQIAFLHEWNTLLEMKDVIALYNTNIQRLLKDVRLKMTEKMAPWRVVCSSSKRKKDLSRDMTFMKCPYFDDIKSQKRSKSEPKLKTNKAETATKINTSKLENSTKIVEPVESDKGIPKAASVTSLPVKKVPVLSERGRPKSATVTGLPKAKAKLIQGLSQPLVSERGLKMMRNMGWEGGALGLRGDGIVEPIALQLDLKKRAGLGCEKEQIKPPKPLTVPVMTNLPVNISRAPPYNVNKTEFKTDILKIILEMLQEATPAMELRFTKKLKQKQWGFINNSVISFNEGTKYMHDVPVLRDLGLIIVNSLSNNNSILTACWGVSKTNVLLVISKAVYQPCDIDSAEWCSVVSLNCPKTDNISVNRQDVNVAVAGKAFRYYVLALILDFCDRSSIDKVPAKTSLTKEIVIKGTIVQKQMSYIKDVIRRLNNKSRPSSDSDNEKAVFKDIIDVMSGFTLDVDFPMERCTNENKAPVYKTIRFHKILNTPKTSELNAPQTKVANKDTKRNTTFTTDTFDEKCMFENQTTTDDQNEPDETKIVQVEPTADLDAPKVAQDPKHDHNEPKIDKHVPKVAQDLKHDHNEPKIDKHVPKVAEDPKHDHNEPKIDKHVPKVAQDLKHDHNEPKIDKHVPKVAQDPKHDHNEPKLDKHVPKVAQDPKHDHNEPKIDKHVPKVAQEPKHDQDELKHNDNALKYHEDAPKTVPVVAPKPNPESHDQNTLKCVPDVLKSDHNTQNAPNIVRNEPSLAANAPNIVQGAPTVGNATRYSPPNLPKLIDGVECITEHIKDNEENVGKSVEYIFIDKETVESNIDGPIPTVTKDNELTSVKTEDFNKCSTTIAHLDTDIQNLSLKDNMYEKTDNLVKVPERTIYGLYLGTGSKIQSISKDYGKRPISNSTTPDKSCKKCRYEKYFKKIVITHKNYPLNTITDECAANIQKSILGSIDYTDELPLLQCHGIQDGGLIYSCHTEKSLDFILNVMKSMDLFVTVTQDSDIICHRMTVKIRSFIKENVDVIFNRLETYNINLETRNWKVLDVERGLDFVTVSMEVDENSYKMIYKEKFTLYTGIDQAKFSILWE